MSLLALLVSAAGGIPGYTVWPGPDNKDLARPGSPGVVRKGDHLEFTGTIPWSAHHATGDRSGRRVSFGAAPPEETPAPASWEHYAPDAVILHGPEKGTITLTPGEFERRARFGYFVLTLLLDFLIAAVFFFVVSLLLRFKGVVLPAFGPLRLLGRCLIPAGLVSGLVAYFGGFPFSDIASGAFVVVLGMNAILFTLGAKPPAAEAFDV